MVYSNKFVMTVYVDGVQQQELANGVVKLPFGSEYVLRFRNRHNRRAVVKFTIDGENVSGNGYIIPANDVVEIKRHREKDAAFKFVSLESEEAYDFGKNGPNEDKVKGVIEAKFYLEKEKPSYVYPTEVHHHHHHYPRPRPAPAPWYDPYPIRYTTCDAGYGEIAKGGVVRDSGATKSATSGDGDFARRVRSKLNSVRTQAQTSMGGLEALSIADCGPTQMTASFNASAPVLKDGCTVEGNTTGQGFWSEAIDYETDFVSIKVFLQGFNPAVSAMPKVVINETNKSKRAKDLEAENEELRRKLAELENEKLKKQLADLESKKLMDHLEDVKRELGKGFPG